MTSILDSSVLGLLPGASGLIRDEPKCSLPGRENKPSDWTAAKGEIHCELWLRVIRNQSRVNPVHELTRLGWS